MGVTSKWTALTEESSKFSMVESRTSSSSSSSSRPGLGLVLEVPVLLRTIGD